MKIAIVVPTINCDQLASFYISWNSLFKKHRVMLFTVFDGIKPRVYQKDYACETEAEIQLDARFSHLIHNLNDGVRNLGFVEAVKSGAEIIITLDDDVAPDGNDPIQEHLDALSGKHPTSWFNPFDGAFMRGFPYEMDQRHPKSVQPRHSRMRCS